VSSGYSAEYAISHLLPDRLEATNVYAYISCTLLPLTDPTLQPILPSWNLSLVVPCCANSLRNVLDAHEPLESASLWPLD